MSEPEQDQTFKTETKPTMNQNDDSGQSPIAGWLEMFSFSTKFDRFLMAIGIMGAMCNGAVWPVLALAYGNIVGSLVKLSQCNDTLIEQEISDETSLKNLLVEAIDQNVIYLIIGGCVALVAAYAQKATWSIAAENQVLVMRKRFFQSLLRQNNAWYDSQSSGSITTMFTEDMAKICNGIGDNVSMGFKLVGGTIAALAVAIPIGWELCLALLALCPLVGLFAVIMVGFIIRFSIKENETYANAGSIAQDVLGAIRTVTAFNGQSFEIKKYQQALDVTRGLGLQKGLMVGSMVGIAFLITISTYGLGFSYGTELIGQPDSGYTIAEVVTVFWSVVMGTVELGLVILSFVQFNIARASAGKIFQIINRVPTIDPYAAEGEKLATNFAGHVQLQSVEFSYPNREDQKVLKGVNLAIEPGQTIALVGQSGCGKSTIVNLILRLYDITSGRILIDGRDIREYNIFSLRNVVGLVGQDPSLFSGTVAENIRAGNPRASMPEIEAAARQANCHDFIMQLQNGYETQVGEHGRQLSGGQKQRIAIARALVRHPRIILLDEATSALDSETEQRVLQSLYSNRQGRTTIIVAHRLSSIISADKIFVFESGKVVEVGQHDELMALGGAYARLFATQQLEQAVEYSNDMRTSMDSPQIKETFSEQRNETSQLNTQIFDQSSKSRFSIHRLLLLASPDWLIYMLGLIAAIAAGAIWPVLGQIYGQILSAFTLCDATERQEQALMYSFIVFGLGVLCFFAHLTLWTTFSVAGERLARRLRIMTFRAMLTQDIEWFDEPANGVGSLTAKLSMKVADIKDGLGPGLGIAIHALVAVLSGAALSFSYSWEIALIMLVFLPILIVSQISFQKSTSNQSIEHATRILAETTSNMRTVASLGNYRSLINKLSMPLHSRYRSQILRLNFGAFLYACHPASTAFVYAAVFYAGGQFIADGTMNFDTLISATNPMLWAAFYAIGQANAMFPNFSSLKRASGELFSLFDRTPTSMALNVVTNDSSEHRSNVENHVQLKNVVFSYPARKQTNVLNDINFAVQPGKTLAIVGPSGSGKSTVIQLLLRFYAANSGLVLVNGKDVRSAEWKIEELRREMALVSQEPVLLDRTIGENIAYGFADRDGVPPSQEEIVEAARQANAAAFIEALPFGYDTKVGERGASLSGGQRQRIVLARALIRKPRILLLDEATSALDSEAEKLVQEALDRACVCRTTIIIAHKLSAIESADCIAVVKDGKIREIGTAPQLIELKGLYYKMRRMQISS